MYVSPLCCCLRDPCVKGAWLWTFRWNRTWTVYYIRHCTISCPAQRQSHPLPLSLPKLRHRRNDAYRYKLNVLISLISSQWHGVREREWIDFGEAINLIAPWFHTALRLLIKSVDRWKLEGNAKRKHAIREIPHPQNATAGHDGERTTKVMKKFLGNDAQRNYWWTIPSSLKLFRFKHRHLSQYFKSFNLSLLFNFRSIRYSRVMKKNAYTLIIY